MTRKDSNGVPQEVKGRADGDRFYQLVSSDPATTGVGLVGFASDIGVTRNLGRPGAHEGPAAIRAALAPLAAHSKNPISDWGDIECPRLNHSDASLGQMLERGQHNLGRKVHEILKAGQVPIVLGGGHETAWGHFQGISSFLQESSEKRNIAIINFDAHFDLRPLPPDGFGTSGTGFRQIITWCRAQNITSSYHVVGIQPAANTPQLLKSATEFGCTYQTAASVQACPDLAKQKITDLLDSHDAVYLTVCLDVFHISVAPGVSATQVLGLFPHQVFPLVQTVLESKKVISTDIVELSPRYDEHSRTARLAAELVRTIHESLPEHPKNNSLKRA